MNSFIHHFILFFFLLSFGSHQAFTQDSRISLLGNINVSHGNSGSTYFSSCWGWVSPDGHEYALLGTCNGTSIIELNSGTFQEVQFVPGPYAAYCLREMKTWKQYAYITTEGGGGVQIVDLSGLPDTAILVKNFIYADSSSGDVKHTTYTHTVTISDGRLYLNGCAGWKPYGGTVIFSLINDPENPEFLAEISRTYFHDSYVRNDTLYASAVYNSGGLGGLYIIDLTDITYPFDLGRITYTGSGTHNSWLSMDGSYVFTADEIGSTPHNMKVWDIRNLPNFQKVATWQADPASIVHNVHGRGNYVYAAHYTAGMAVIDVRDPENPVTAGWYDSYPGASGGYAGSWEVYPYFPSGKWIGSDMQTGLYVFTFDSLKPRQRVHLFSPPDSAQYAFFPGPTFSWSSAANPSEDPHFYEVHVKGGDFDTAIQMKNTYWEGLFSSRMKVGDYYNWFVLTRDEYTEVSSIDTFTFLYSGPDNVQEQPQPNSFFMAQNYPNPFNPITKIEFGLKSVTEVTLKIFDQQGREVAILLDNELLGPGKQEALFNAQGLPSGAYYYQISASSKIETRVMFFIK